MKILHTSDWHLGRSLYGRKRYNEFTEFLDWLSDTIEQKNIDVLLVAGDIFDSNTPVIEHRNSIIAFSVRLPTPVVVILL